MLKFGHFDKKIARNPLGRIDGWGVDKLALYRLFLLKKIK